MNESIFRKKSMERVSSPEKLDDYIKITSVSMWLVLAAIILLLLAAVIWGFTGRIEETIVCPDGQTRVESVKPISLLID